VMCPVCGTPLNLAEEAPQAERERAFIQREIDRCRSKDQIKRDLVSQYGDRVLALPGDEGTSLGDVLVYVVPGVAILLAGIAVAIGASRWRRRRRPAAPGGAPAASKRLDADMERYDL
jgi:cytochrome c-type biogenesis protein CcmH